MNIALCVHVCVSIALSGGSGLTVILHRYQVCVRYYLHQPGRHLTSGEGPRYGVIKASEGREQESGRTQGVYVCLQIAERRFCLCLCICVWGQGEFVLRYRCRYRDTQGEGKRRGGEKERHLATV